jgi:hypothetical protein
MTLPDDGYDLILFIRMLLEIAHFQVQHSSQEYRDAVENYKEQRHKVSHLKKMVKGTKGFFKYKQIVDARNFTIEKIGRLETRSHRLSRRISQIEPTGWKEFLQVYTTILLHM